MMFRWRVAYFAAKDPPRKREREREREGEDPEHMYLRKIPQKAAVRVSLSTVGWPPI